MLRPDPADAVEEWVDLGRADMDPSRRGVLAAGVFSAALALPGFSGPPYAGERPVSPGRRTIRIGASHVRAVRTMTDRVAGILDELGAGHARPMAAAFLVNTVGPWLRAQASETVRLLRQGVEAGERGAGPRGLLPDAARHESPGIQPGIRAQVVGARRLGRGGSAGRREAQPEVERQGRVHAYALLAQRQYAYGHLDASCASWGRFLDDYEHVSSARGDDHFGTMLGQLRRRASSRPARDLAGRAREVAGLKN